MIQLLLPPDTSGDFGAAMEYGLLEFDVQRLAALNLVHDSGECSGIGRGAPARSEFLGAPRLLSTSQDCGSSSLKWANANGTRIAVATPASKNLIACLNGYLLLVSHNTNR
jgi:hypothetical protein